MSRIRIEADCIVRRSGDHLAAEVAGDVVLLSIERGSYYGLDDIASDVWRRLAEPVRVGDLCEALLASYRAEPEALRRDVAAFLARLADEGLIIVGPPEAPVGG